jgi:N-acetylglucosaminyl-diphospho-decaprenol L-rhamnosyltransferase
VTGADPGPAPAPDAAPPPVVAGLTSLVIVAADSGPALAAAVASGLAQDAAVELIVVDNASSDGAVEDVAARSRGEARLRIVRNAANLGFGAGCNRGARQAHGDALLFVNPDCELPADAVARLRSAAGAATGVLGARIVAADGRVEPASRRRDPLLRRAAMAMSGLAVLERRWPAFAGVDLPEAEQAVEVEPVDAVSGALLYVPRRVFDAVGGFDEGYFLHAEDLDLCRRVRDAGFAVACVNGLRVVHGKGGSSRHRPLFVARHKHRGMWRWFVKFDPAARNPALRGVVRAALCLHFAALAPLLAWRQWRAQR